MRTIHVWPRYIKEFLLTHLGCNSPPSLLTRAFNNQESAAGYVGLYSSRLNYALRASVILRVVEDNLRSNQLQTPSSKSQTSSFYTFGLPAVIITHDQKQVADNAGGDTNEAFNTK